jgi:hypothetical protein
MHQHPVFHVDRLSPWSGNDINGLNPSPPPPIKIDDELEYEVEDILDSRKYRNQFQYLVKWKGYDAGHNSWEPATHLTHCADLLTAFHAAHPSAPRRLAASLFSSLPWRPRQDLTQTSLHSPSDLSALSKPPRTSAFRGG